MKLIFTILTLGYFTVFSQNQSVTVNDFERYDQSLISPSLRKKHSISLGPVLKVATIAPLGQDAIDAKQAWHFGYNYLILNQRKLKLSIKERRRTEIKGLGLHFTLIDPDEHYLMATFFHPYFAKKGRLFSFYFLSEYGIGYHYNKNPLNDTEEIVKWHVSMEALRFRFGSLPLFLNLNVNYALANDLLAKTRWEVEVMCGLRYYFYRGR